MLVNVKLLFLHLYSLLYQLNLTLKSGLLYLSGGKRGCFKKASPEWIETCFRVMGGWIVISASGGCQF